jgi:histidine triad (HIT) family protein
MHKHAPIGYICPFCRIIREARVHGYIASPTSDVICQTETATAFLGLGRWEKTPLDVLIVPNAHFENIFDLPLSLAADLHELTRQVSIALKVVLHAEGVSSRQHNEPAGDQDVWHYHVHVTPRFVDDNFYRSCRVPFVETERLQFARALQGFFLSQANI